jgi:hypothetical protein
MRPLPSRAAPLLLSGIGTSVRHERLVVAGVPSLPWAPCSRSRSPECRTPGRGAEPSNSASAEGRSLGPTSLLDRAALGSGGAVAAAPRPVATRIASRSDDSGVPNKASCIAQRGNRCSTGTPPNSASDVPCGVRGSGNGAGGGLAELRREPSWRIWAPLIGSALQSGQRRSLRACVMHSHSSMHLL